MEALARRFFDLSAAFDTVDHGTLNKILSKDFGMQQKVRKWILSYLSDREQFVNFEGENSKTNLCGLPKEVALDQWDGYSMPASYLTSQNHTNLMSWLMQTTLN